ncbi:hypothetical protein PMAYCL1PPCAC_33277, partial [Pristionchus mayeri]
MAEANGRLEEEKLLEREKGEKIVPPSQLDEDALLGDGKGGKAKEDIEMVDGDGKTVEEVPGLVQDGGARAVLKGAEMKTWSAAKQDELVTKIEELEKDVAIAYDCRDKALAENNSLKAEIKGLKETVRVRKERDDTDEEYRQIRERELLRAYRGDDVAAARQGVTEGYDGANRTTVLPGHPMHPDFECKECGRRRVGDVVPEKIQRRMGSVVTALHFDSLRELGALYDLESEWKTLTRLSAHTNMKDRARRKEVGTSALKKAYQDGMCQHVLAEVEHVSGTGVTMEGEDKSVSDAINEALLIGGEKKHRTECIVLIPEDRPFPTLRGEWDEVVGVNYKDEDEMKKILQEMEVSDSFPKSLWIMLARKSSIGSTEKLRAYLLDLTKNYSLTCYLSAAVLPVTPTDFELELAKTHQQFLTSWRSEGTPPNLVLLTVISGH